MGESHLHVNAEEFSRLALLCNSCKTHLVIAADDDNGPTAEVRCSCGALMAGVPRLIAAYRAFYRELKAQQRPGYFVVKQ